METRMAKKRINLYMDMTDFDYLRARGIAEHRTPGNMAMFLLKEKIQEEITREQDGHYEWLEKHVDGNKRKEFFSRDK